MCSQTSSVSDLESGMTSATCWTLWEIWEKKRTDEGLLNGQGDPEKKVKKRKNKLQASTAGPLSFGLFIFHTQHVQGSICSLIRGISSTSFFIDEFRWRQKLRGVSPPAASNTTWFTIYRTASCIDCITETKSQMTAVIMSSLSAELQGECFMLSLSRWSQLQKRTIIELNRATCAAESLSLLQYYTNKQFLLPKCIYFQFEIRVKKDRNISWAPVKKHQQYLD